MTIGQIVKLKIMPDESWEVIQQQGEQFCLMNLEEPRMAIWARDSELIQPIPTQPKSCAHCGD